MTAWTGEVALALSGRLDLAILAKATIVLALGLAATPLAWRARASVRHLLLAATFGTVLVLPVVVGIVPAVNIRVPGAAKGRGDGRAAGEVLRGFASASSASLATDENAGDLGARASLAILVRAVWAAGAVLLLALLAIDLGRLRALRRRGLPWPAQRDLTRSLATACGVRRSVTVVLHEDVASPLTCGVWRPVIFLPVDASEWPAADLRRALIHELEHVRRGDWATQLLARVVCACYWFHPLVWTAWRRLRLEAERACDDAVVQSAECTEYAEQLVSLARRLTVRALPSLAMASRSDLSARVFALLDTTRRRGRVGHAATGGVIGVACLVVLVVAPVRAIAAPTTSPRSVEALQSVSDVAAESRRQDGGVRARDARSPRQTRVAPREAAARRAPRAIERSERTSAEPRTPARPRTPRVIERPRRALAPRKPARPREARTSTRPRSAMRDTTWKTQSTRTLITSSSPGDGITQGTASHSSSASSSAQHSSSID